MAIQFKKRKRGTPSQIGKAFPVATSGGKYDTPTVEIQRVVRSPTRETPLERLVIERGSKVICMAEDDLTVEFAKFFRDYQRIGTGKLSEKKEEQVGERWHTEVNEVMSKPGFVGSGHWIYEYKGVQFKVDGSASGRGFWGTTYWVERI